MSRIDHGPAYEKTLSIRRNVVIRDLGQRLDDRARRSDLEALTAAHWSREDPPVGAAFDPSSAKIRGPAVVVAENVASGFGVIRSMFSASRSGDLVYVTEPTNFDVHVEWVDRGGHRSPAAVNHSHIASLYSFEEASGRHPLVMELVEGQTLADRLLKGPLAPDQLLKTAIEIASALDAAHRVDRHVASQLRVLGPVDLSHPSRAERREDLVRAEACARLNRQLLEV